jgi:hypothetical protein
VILHIEGNGRAEALHQLRDVGTAGLDGNAVAGPAEITDDDQPEGDVECPPRRRRRVRRVPEPHAEVDPAYRRFVARHCAPRSGGSATANLICSGGGVGGNQTGSAGSGQLGTGSFNVTVVGSVLFLGKVA